MWYKKLNDIASYGKKINIGAEAMEIANFQTFVKDRLKQELPEGYINCLRIVNGLEFNGFMLYGIDESLMETKSNQSINGLIEINLIWYENVEQKKYLFLGDSNISWYVYQPNCKVYLELDKPSGDEINRFANFDDMFNKLLEDALL